MAKVEYIPEGTVAIERYAYYERADITEVKFCDGLLDQLSAALAKKDEEESE